MFLRILSCFIWLISAPAFAQPYEMSGSVFAILNLPFDCPEEQAEQSYQNLVQVHADDPLALKILDYAKQRVWLIRGWVFIGNTRILPFEGFTKAAYRSDSDILHIYRRLLDDEHRQFYLYQVLVERRTNAAAYLAALNLPELAVATRSPVFDRSDDLSFFNRQLAEDLVVSVNRLGSDRDVMPGDLLFQIFTDVLTKSRSDGLLNEDRGPLAGLLLSVAGRLPPDEKKKFFEQLEAFIKWRLPLTTLANVTPFIPYYGPEREVLLRQIRNWLEVKWRKPPRSAFHNFCSRFLGIGE